MSNKIIHLLKYLNKSISSGFKLLCRIAQRIEDWCLYKGRFNLKEVLFLVLLIFIVFFLIVVSNHISAWLRGRRGPGPWPF